MSTQNPAPVTPDGGGEPVAPAASGGAPPPPPAPGPNLQGQPAPQPSGSDALWLVITVINLTLLSRLLPEDWLKFGETLAGFWAKIVPTVIVVLGLGAGYLWLREQVAQLVRQRAFQVINLALLAVLLPILVSGWSIFPIRPKVEPDNALVGVAEDKPAEYEKDQWVFVPIRPHTAVVSSADGEDERKIKVGYGDVLSGLFGFFHRPNWSLYNRITVNTAQADVEVVIRRTDGPFDPDYLNGLPETGLTPLTSVKRDPKDPSVILYAGTGKYEGAGDSIRLPPGTYEVVGRRRGCDEKTQPKILTVEYGRRARGIIIQPLCNDKPR